MKKWEDFKKKSAQKDRERIGDVYDECVSRGCDINILRSLETRVWLYPVKQVMALLSIRNNKYTDEKSLNERLRQYKIFLEVLIEKKPDSNMIKEWQNALNLLE